MTTMRSVTNCETGETTEIPLTVDELAQKDKDANEDKAARAARASEEAAFAKDRADGLAKLEALGLLSKQAIAVARKAK